MAAFRMTGYDRALFELRSMTEQLGSEVQKLLTKAVGVLENFDSATREDWRKEDDKIDQMRDRIVNRSLEIMSLQQLRTQDLRWLLGYHRIAQELERIADYACDIAELAELNPARDWPASVLAMARQVKLMFAYDMDFLKPDFASAINLDELDDFLDSTYAELQKDFFRETRENKNSGLGFALVVARTIERMGDHVVNVAETVMYIQTGQKTLTPKA